MEEVEIRTIKTTFIAHGSTEIEVIYTNDVKQVEEILEVLKRKQLKMPPEEEFMGLDLEYTFEHKDKQKVAMLQLCVDRTVLVWQLARPEGRCEELFDWFCARYSKFASVDIRGDRQVMYRTWGFKIPLKFHVDIQDIYHIRGRGERTGMSALTGELIDSSYEDMKKNVPPNGHDFWEKQPLDEANLKYAAIDGVVAFELYRKLQCIQKGLLVLRPPRKVGIDSTKFSAASSPSTSGSKRSKWEGKNDEDGWNKSKGWSKWK